MPTPARTEATAQPRRGLACGAVREGVRPEGEEVKVCLSGLPRPTPRPRAGIFSLPPPNLTTSVVEYPSEQLIKGNLENCAFKS